MEYLVCSEVDGIGEWCCQVKYGIAGGINGRWKLGPKSRGCHRYDVDDGDKPSCSTAGAAKLTSFH